METNESKVQSNSHNLTINSPLNFVFNKGYA